MLVKYLGTTTNQHIPRSEFLENGLFRMTQPKFLNDKGSEAKFFPYFDEFSPADIAYARKRFLKFNAELNPELPSDEELINFYLKPAGERYTLEKFPTLLGFTGYDSIEAYNAAQKENLEKAIKGFNSFVLEALSCYIGIFSLSKNAVNELMWTHYANQGMGLAVTFKEEHPFFKEFQPHDVSYKHQDRASITYYEGTIRINGEYSDSFKIKEELNLLNLYKLFSQDSTKYMELIKRLLYSKYEDWKYEEEIRIICPLQLCEGNSGNIIEPSFDSKIPENLLTMFSEYPEICFKKIPFDAFDSIIFGYAVSDSQREDIITKAQRNPNLGHLRFEQADHDIYGKIVIKELHLT